MYDKKNNVVGQCCFDRFKSYFCVGIGFFDGVSVFYCIMFVDKF